MTHLQLKSFVEAKHVLVLRNPALALDFIGEDAGGWVRWDVRRGGQVELVGSVHEAPDGLVIVRLQQ
jgi:hypothetical protein